MFGPVHSKYNILDDAGLLARYRKTKDLEVLGVLYHRHMHLVYGVCLKYLKEREASKDAVMHIFEKLINTISKEEIRNFKSWLYVVTRNHCLMELRSKRVKLTIDDLFMESHHFLHHNGEQSEDLEGLLAKALSNLSEPQQRCIKLFYYENRSYQQIARETGYELKKVKSHIQNGKRNLKIYLDQYESK